MTDGGLLPYDDRRRPRVERHGHLVLGVLRAQDGPLTPAQLADKLWWLDWVHFTRSGEGCFNQDWVMTPAGPALAGLGALMQGRLPSAWLPWVQVADNGAVQMTEEGLGLDLDCLSVWTEKLALETATTDLLTIACLKHALIEQRPGPLGLIPLDVIFALCGFSADLIPTLVQGCLARRGLDRAWDELDGNKKRAPTDG